MCHGEWSHNMCSNSCLFYLVPLLNRQGTRGKWQVIPFNFNCKFTGLGHITLAATLGEELVRGDTMLLFILQQIMKGNNIRERVKIYLYKCDWLRGIPMCSFMMQPHTTHTAYLICCILTQCIVTSIYNLSCFFSWHIARLYHMRRKVLEDKICYCTIWNSHTQRKAKEAGMNFV